MKQVRTLSSERVDLSMADYGRVELATLVQLHHSGELHGRDMYRVAAAQMFDVSYEDVTEAQRQVAKSYTLRTAFGVCA